MPIPSSIQPDHILAAFNEIDEKGIPRNRSYDRYYVKYNSNRYPVKYVISIAVKFTNKASAPLASGSFNTYEAQTILEDLGFSVVDMYAEELFKYKGFRMLALQLSDNKLLGTISYSFGDDGDKQDQLYTTVVIGPNGTGKSNLFRIIIELFRELNDLKAGGKRQYIVDGLFDMKYSLNGDIFNYTNMVGDEDSPRQDSANARAVLLRNGEIIDYTDAQMPIAIVANSIMLTDKFPVYVDNSKFPIYKYLGTRNTPQGASTRSYVRRTVDYIVEESNNQAFRKGLAKITGFLGIKSTIDVYYSTINAPTFFRGQTSMDTFDKYFGAIDDKYKGSTYPPQKLNVYKRLKKEGDLLERLSEFCNKLFFSERLIRIKKGSSVHKVNYNIIDERDFELLKAEFSSLENLRSLGLLYSPEINLHQDDAYPLQESSSGEYHFLSSMVGLMATVKSNSLVFLDEPEASLHPNWQMSYLTFLHSLFADTEYRTCHIMAATHSHFLISDIEGSRSKIIGLKRALKTDNDQHRFEIVELPKNVDTYGWSAEDVLYNIFGVASTRNKYVADIIGDILSVMAKADKSKTNTLSKRDYELLIDLSRNLKEIDPLKKVVRSILNQVNNANS